MYRNGDVVYEFDYDKLGRKTTVNAGNQILSTNVYKGDRSGLLDRVEYGNYDLLTNSNSPVTNVLKAKLNSIFAKAG